MGKKKIVSNYYSSLQCHMIPQIIFIVLIGVEDSSKKFCSIINVVTVTFDKFNASLLN